jgi:hypothetical protein
MRSARVAVVLGLLLLGLGFYVGIETPISTTVAGQSYDCSDVIPARLLVSGQPTSREAGPDTRTPAERRLDARISAGCDPLERGAQWAVWGGLGLGGLLLLTGWTALREREHDQQVAARRAEVPVGS